MSDDHPVNDPGQAAPTWVALPTMPWTRVVPQANPEHSDDSDERRESQYRREPDPGPGNTHESGESRGWFDAEEQPRDPHRDDEGSAYDHETPRRYPTRQGQPTQQGQHHGHQAQPAHHGQQGQQAPPQRWNAPPGIPDARPYDGPPQQRRDSGSHGHQEHQRRAPQQQEQQAYHQPQPQRRDPQQPPQPQRRDPQQPQQAHQRDTRQYGPPPTMGDEAPGQAGKPNWVSDATSIMPIVPRTAGPAAPSQRQPSQHQPAQRQYEGPQRHTTMPPPGTSRPSGTAAVPPPRMRPDSRPPQGPDRDDDHWAGDNPAPVSAVPISGIPISGIPVSGVPVSGIPVSGIPVTSPPFDTESDGSGHREPEGPDPEQILTNYEWRFDPETLREVVNESESEELQTVRELLTRKVNRVADNATRARLLSLRAVVSRILGDLHKALADGKLALAHAEATGELRRIAIAQARLAHVLQWREEYEEADRLFALANSTELPDRLRATMHQHAGKCAYDQGFFIEACVHFEQAAELRKEDDPEFVEQMSLALDAVFRRVSEKGWGGFPRTKEQILKIRKPPTPSFIEATQRWGYVSEDGTFAVEPTYTDAQPFRDGAAWVQRQGSETWELIDEHGRVLIEPASGYLGVSSFNDGVAWVSRDGGSHWIAIDKSNTVLISTGFDDVRPFRRGLAAVRRGTRWGAVDSAGRIVVPLQYDQFATAMHDGRYIDGFSDEGLAIVSLGGRKGVVDRSGRVIVSPKFPMLVIHPVAFLLCDTHQRWGALDRRGRLLIDPEFPSRITVVEEIDRRLAHTRAML